MNVMMQHQIKCPLHRPFRISIGMGDHLDGSSSRKVFHRCNLDIIEFDQVDYRFIDLNPMMGIENILRNQMIPQSEPGHISKPVYSE